jgi:hypothetical protein
MQLRLLIPMGRGFPRLSRTFIFLPLLAGVLLATSGCDRGGLKLAPVAGLVTLNNQPLPGAVVTFQPEEGVEAPASMGKTDAQGRYDLSVTVTGQPGALVGKHKVTITAGRSEQSSGDDSITKIVEPVPKRYNSETTLSFDNPSSGSKQANFALQAP